MSDRINELIMAVKQMIEDKLQKKDVEDGIREIQNQIDEKHLQIRDLFSNNLNDVITHYVKYQEVLSNQKSLQFQCEQFSKKIEKYQKLSQYDEALIQRNQKTLLDIDRTKSKLIQYRDYVKLVKKVAINLKQQRYNNAIKIINQMKTTQPKGNTPLKKVIKISIEKVTQHLDRLVQSFWESSVSKQQQIGMLCFNKVLLNQHEKANIYQTFFSRNSRNTMTSGIGLRTTVQQAPMRYFKKIGTEQSQILNKYTVRVRIQMTALKQVKILCGQLGEQSMFKELVINQMRKVLKKIGEEVVCEKQEQLKKMLSRIIGFLLVKREVVAYFDLKAEDKLFISQVYSLIGTQLKTMTPNPGHNGQSKQSIEKDIQSVKQIKQLLDVFHSILKILNLQKSSWSYSQVLQILFRTYCAINLQQCQTMIMEAIQGDNFALYNTQLLAEQKVFNDVLGVSVPQFQYPFTSVVVSLIEIFSKYYDNLYYFIRDSNLNKSQLHDHLASLFQTFINLYGANLMLRDQPLSIVQGQANLDYSQNILKYYSNQLEYEHVRVNEWTYCITLEKKVVQLRTRVRMLIQNKIYDLFLVPEYMPKQIRSEPHDQIIMMMSFLKSILQHMRGFKTAIHEDIALTAIKQISNIFWDILKKGKAYNLAFIYDMDLDLLQIYKECAKNLRQYPDITDPFNSLRQLYAFLLTNNINDILVKQKRQISYPHLNIRQIMPILKKYDSTTFKDSKGKVRQLRKKDLDSVIKKLEIQFK